MVTFFTIRRPLTALLIRGHKVEDFYNIETEAIGQGSDGEPISILPYSNLSIAESSALAS